MQSTSTTQTRKQRCSVSSAGVITNRAQWKVWILMSYSLRGYRRSNWDGLRASTLCSKLLSLHAHSHAHTHTHKRSTGQCSQWELWSAVVMASVPCLCHWEIAALYLLGTDSIMNIDWLLMHAKLFHYWRARWRQCPLNRAGHLNTYLGEADSQWHAHKTKHTNTYSTSTKCSYTPTHSTWKSPNHILRSILQLPD